MVLSLALSSTLVLAAPPAPKAAGIESKDYQWAKMEGELKEALAKKGDVKRGQDTYEICGACHLPTGAGRSDGTFPQLAGQHTTVLIKQMADIRMGLRDNPTMYPFAKEMTDPQDLADTSAYIQSLCIPVDHGKYEGADAAKQIAAGKDLYEKQCKECHGAERRGQQGEVLSRHRRPALQVPAAPDDGDPRRPPPQRQPGHGEGHQALHQRPAGGHLRLPVEPLHAGLDVQAEGRRRQGQEEVMPFPLPPARPGGRPL